MYRVFLAAALLACCTGESSVHGPPEKVLASAGGDVILPCSFSITPSDDFPTVEWSKKDLQPDVVFLYQSHCETYAMKNPAFKYRTSLIMEELQNGNISLRISKVQLSDAGIYQCKRIWANAPHNITSVELVVGAVSEPKLSVIISAESGEVTLQCEADCWLSEPEITFLDDHGNSIPADEQKRREDVSGCYTGHLQSSPAGDQPDQGHTHFYTSSLHTVLLSNRWHRCWTVRFTSSSSLGWTNGLFMEEMWQMCGTKTASEQAVIRSKQSEQYLWKSTASAERQG